MDGMRVIVGITGASGALYALELLRHLRSAGHEAHTVVSGNGWKLLEHECGAGKEDIAALSSYAHDNENLGASIASGSFQAEAMIIVPCSMRTLAAVASGLADNLICRAADVMLKERRNLVLAVRETPLSAVHLENMLKLARLGVGIMPLCPAFYHHPQSIADLATALAGRIMDNLNIPNQICKRWQGA